MVDGAAPDHGVDVVAVPPGRHANALQIGAGVWLGERQPAADLARCEPRQPVAALRLGAELAVEYHLTEGQIVRIVSAMGVTAPEDRRQSVLF